jgi:hypothetical protein
MGKIIILKVIKIKLSGNIQRFKDKIIELLVLEMLLLELEIL